MSTNYEWINFYKEFADKLLEYKNNREELIKIVENVFTSFNLKNPLLYEKYGKEGMLEDVCPFTIFGTFNKGITEKNKIEILKRFNKYFQIQIKIPESFDGVPRLNNMNSWFFGYKEDREENDIDNLWDLFEGAIIYADNDGSNKDDFIEIYNKVINQKGINFNITFGLYWIRPNNFISLDSNNREVLKKTFNIKINNSKVLDGKEYLEINEKIREEILTGKYSYKSIPEFSHEAWDTSGAIVTDIDISYENWIELIEDREIFKEKDIDMIITMINSGGGATCKELGLIYNKSPQSFSIPVISIGKRMKKKINFDIPKNKEGEERWWNILFNGKIKDDDKNFTWIVRPELKEAMKNIYPEKFKSNINYYWLIANTKIWSYNNIKIGEEQFYDFYNKNENKRRIFSNFENATPGDIVFGYLTSPEKSIVALLEVSKNENEKLYFEKIRDIKNGVSYDDIKDIEGLQNMEVMKNPNGSLFKVEQNEAAVLLKMIESRNEVTKNIETYNKQKFLEDVFIDEEEYDDLKSLVLRKKNIILQGPPGVGKTYAAKRLAFSIIGYEDESKVKSIQFHQSYSYEDFMMGYRPNEDKFSLEYGVFYNFCEEARKDKENKYFFIIDEINRGNLSKIFGELLMLLEKDKREQEIHLAYGDIKFSVPENLYIIGTMNTADRSLAIIDYALRRRFSFFELEPAFGKECFKNFLNDLNMEEDLVNRIIGRVDNLNIQIEDSSNLGKGFKIGHSYFCDYDPDDENWYENVIKYEIKPLLEEYWFDDLEKAKEYIKTLLG